MCPLSQQLMCLFAWDKVDTCACVEWNQQAAIGGGGVDGGKNRGRGEGYVDDGLNVHQGGSVDDSLELELELELEDVGDAGDDDDGEGEKGTSVENGGIFFFLLLIHQVYVCWCDVREETTSGGPSVRNHLPCCRRVSLLFLFGHPPAPSPLWNVCFGLF